jgi:hypothetical protein
MAGDWIKMRIELQSHPKIVRILSATQSDKFRAIGGLHAVWSVFDLHSENGKLHGYTPVLMDHIIGWDGFSQAMVDVGWLLFDGSETLSMPEFAEHNGKSAKRRAEDQKRKRDERKRPQSVRNLSANESDEKRTREEKRREESKQSPLPPSRKRGAVEFKTWMDSCKAAGEKPISEYRAIFDYAESIRLPVDFLQLAWAEFSRRHSPGGVDCRKKKSDWRAYFRKAVEGNWYHLWFHDVSTDQFSLTSNGRAAERATA